MNEYEYWLSLLGIVLGSFACGWAAAMIRAKHVVRQAFADEPVGDELAEPQLWPYKCCECGKAIERSLPAGLVGDFAHIECERKRQAESNAVLDEEYIDA